MGLAAAASQYVFSYRGSRYQEETSIARGGEEQLDIKTDVKMDVKLDMELDMKISHERAREEREACARGEEDVQAGPVPALELVIGANSDEKIVNQENKNSADLMTWREYEALRNEMRREFRAQDDELKGTVQEISQKLDATNETVTAMQDQMTDIQRTLRTLTMTVENLNQHRQQTMLVMRHVVIVLAVGLHLAAMVVDKMRKMDWLKIEKLWNLHPHYTEDRKIKLASSEFDGYALRWWDAFVRNRDEDGEQPIRTWRAMKEAMTSRFVPTNYLRNIYDKLTLLRQGVKTVDEYYMEMEMLMQRGRVRESLEM
ncbi:hypothetical protein QYE76_070685 [Lolium multiflorum]|uniref:Retrotransposon gag domain-containing protein n=1 Tax=Lolium multiflorum TaxID=4521 RepID=A0AAD8WEN7_LOLMU|nr:hypothetical protein QYE76_070685 [Lolium multiflorum]